MNKISKLVDSSGMVLTSEAIKNGYDKKSFYNYINNNGYEQIGHGVYCSPDSFIDGNYVLSLRCPHAIFSHDEALYYHDLTDREPFQKTITVYTGYGRKKLEDEGIKVFSVKKDLLDVGKIIITNSFGHNIPIYDAERTICDLVRCRSQFEIQDFTTALKSYARKKNKDLNKLMKYAELFHVDKKIREYMEVLL